MSDIISIYIPRVASNVDESYVKNIFNHAVIGYVVRVDFTPLGKKPGFREIINDDYKSAFVHFQNPLYKTSAAMILTYHLQYDIGYRFYPSCVQEGYWMILPNKRPIPYTMMNSSQIVQNCRFLENKIEEQTQQIEEQTETIKKLEKRTEELEKIVKDLLVSKKSSVVPNIIEYEDDDSMSTHSSMPDLIDYDDSTHSSMPHLIEDDDDSCDSDRYLEHDCLW
jgi:hypothetical protein